MELINEVAKAPFSYPPTRSLKDLEVNKRYIVNDVRKANTKFGPKVLLTLEDSFRIFLPARINKLLINNGEVYKNFESDIIVKGIYFKYLGGGGIEFTYEMLNELQ